MKKITVNAICIILLILGIMQIINSSYSFYNIKKHLNIYINSISDVQAKHLQDDFKKELTTILREFTSFLASYDALYYFSIVYSITLVIIAILLFNYKNRARIALLWYSTISLIYNPYIIILREGNIAKTVNYYESISNVIEKYTQSNFTAFNYIIDNWYRYRLERVASKICIVVILTLFYSFIIYFFTCPDIKKFFREN